MNESELQKMEYLSRTIYNMIKIDEVYLYLNDDAINDKYQLHKKQYEVIQNKIKELRGDINDNEC